jgi:cysteine desulfurase/selenocysteine lyase
MKISPSKSECRAAFELEQVRKDFPILETRIRGKDLVYLDNAATTQKPNAVIDAIAHFYRAENSNVHRGVHYLSELATNRYEASRRTIAEFVGAEANELVFVRGATEAINLVAQCFARSRVSEGDEILISEMEHHSNIVPWQMVCEQTGATLRVAPVTDRGELDMEAFEKLLTERTKLVSVVHISNVTGTVNPVKTITRMAHDAGAHVLLDGAQAAPHTRVDVKELGCDFYVFSGHKVYGPTGVGAVYAPYSIWEEMPPYHGGGDMIRMVTFERTTYNDPPFKFEAGTPNIAGAIGFAAALDYVDHLGIDHISEYEDQLTDYLLESLRSLPSVKLIGDASERAGAVSFVLEGVHPHDVGTFLDQEGIAIRTGHHCAQPLMKRFGVPATSRASLGLYNTPDEIDRLIEGISKVQEFFAP